MVNTIQLQKRRIAKRRKPSFVVKESHFIARVKKRWRLPRGLHSAARQRYRGRPAQPHPGYGSPQEVRGLSREGLIPVRVHTERDFSLLTPGVHGAVIGRSVGSRKKLALLQLAQEKKIKIIYVKDVFSLVTKMKETLARRQEVRRSQKQEKMKKQVEHRKKSAEKEKKETGKKEKKEKESKIWVFVILILTALASLLFSMRNGGWSMPRRNENKGTERVETIEEVVKEKDDEGSFSLFGPAVYEFEK